MIKASDKKYAQAQAYYKKRIVHAKNKTKSQVDPVAPEDVEEFKKLTVACKRYAKGLEKAKRQYQKMKKLYNELRSRSKSRTSRRSSSSNMTPVHETTETRRLRFGQQQRSHNRADKDDRSVQKVS